jgi:hypothetical protein
MAAWARIGLWGNWIILALVLWPRLAEGTEPRVAGFNDLVILDPGANPQGLPAVKVRVSADGTKTDIDIPPTIHVHRYYFSGNKEYQGPIIAGGPTVVVASNPWSGERMYIDVMLPAGAPIIAYNKDGITYTFQDRRVFITFPRLCREKAVVTYASGRGVDRCIQETTAKVKESTAKVVQESKVVGTLKKTAKDAKDVATGVLMAVGGAGNFAIETVTKFAPMIPGIQAMQSLGQQFAERAEHEALQQGQFRQEAEATQFIKTNR